MALPDSFQSDDFVRYAAECNRLARLAMPAERKRKRAHGPAFLLIWFGLLGSAVIEALR